MEIQRSKFEIEKIEKLINSWVSKVTSSSSTELSKRLGIYDASLVSKSRK